MNIIQVINYQFICMLKSSYASSISSLEIEFWDRLVRDLQKLSVVAVLLPGLFRVNLSKLPQTDLL